ncbi:CbtB-domain containing protein [Microbacterium sp. SORGH_AS_0888]|uniref:CbtB domain-containing protein n=1 Tax=Microbacterium sp. SORGH_AS_0888 TaxID=3041791 RepID=UPI002786B136|nr:CbtB-domain containing protein [Microbacterium sp. SORGH_AS_0888]MDQ1128100.1 hypothetical protein [Microbacterium sp. SORGH_AS_0888]
MSTHSEVVAVPTARTAGAAVRALWIAGAVLVAAAAYYFVGIDQGVVSVFGSDTHIHEMMHDGRHMLGFPCH